MRVQHRAPRGMIPEGPPVETSDAPRIFAWDRHVGAVVAGSSWVAVVVVVFFEMRWGLAAGATARMTYMGQKAKKPSIARRALHCASRIQLAPTTKRVGRPRILDGLELVIAKTSGRKRAREERENLTKMNECCWSIKPDDEFNREHIGMINESRCCGGGDMRAGCSDPRPGR
ncbi:hypothetical protein JOL62DRAFT_41664 [Phyllosticta paracitricarpa]|uniref:Uncharacterized protein n=1 Tax=Phyllosticta paracitricarpa TaxID=2016321 RepID=A0ABR1NAL6_9PEZI